MIFQVFTFILSFFIIACSVKNTSSTQVMVQIDAQLDTRTQTQSVEIRVRSGHGKNTEWENRFDRKMIIDSDKYRWPLQFSLVPQNDDVTRVYEITATALDSSGIEIARVRAISGYRSGEALLLPLLFDDLCIGKISECTDTQTCSAGNCVDANVNVDELSSFDVNNDSDGQMNGHDSGVNSGTDSGFGSTVDSGSDPIVDSGSVGNPGSDSGIDSGSDSGPVGSCTDTVCGGSCVDLNTDPMNCGACGYKAVHGRTCISGVPTPAWQSLSIVGAPPPTTGHAAVFSEKLFTTIGGLDSSSNPTSAVYVYDPSRDTWGKSSPLKNARYGHKAVTTYTGGIYVFGGFTDSSGTLIGTLEFASAGGTDFFSFVATSGTAPQARSDFAMVSIPSTEKLFVFGGQDLTGYLADGSVFDPVARSWTDASCSLSGCKNINSSLPTTGYTNAFIDDSGNIDVWGGFSKDALKYTVSTDTFSANPVPSGVPSFVPSRNADDGRRIFFLKSTGSCPGITTVSFYDRVTDLMLTDTSAPPSTLVDSSATAWTGSELIAWSGSCGGGSPLSVGGRYQPPAP